MVVVVVVVVVVGGGVIAVVEDSVTRLSRIHAGHYKGSNHLGYDAQD
jgi:hypothetical protein